MAASGSRLDDVVCGGLTWVNGGLMVKIDLYGLMVAKCRRKARLDGLLLLLETQNVEHQNDGRTN